MKSFGRIEDAYPILEAGCGDKVDKIGDYLSRFSDLTSCGGNGELDCSSIRDMMLTDERAVKKCAAGA